MKQALFSIEQNLFLHSHPLPLWIALWPSLDIHFTNQKALDLLNIDEQFSGNFYQLLNEHSAVHLFQSISNEDGLVNGVYTFKKKDNTIIQLELLSNKIEAGGNNWIQITGSDQTVNIRNQEQLIQEKKRYKSYIDYSTEGIYCQEFRDPININEPFEEIFKKIKIDGFISECNDVMACMYGFLKAEELIGMHVAKLIDFEDPANLKAMKQFVQNGFQARNIESIEKAKDNTQIYFINNAIGIIENGYLKRIWGTQKDITNQKRDEERFRFLASMVEQTTDVLTAADLDFKPIFWNKAAEIIYGLTSEQVIGKDLREFIAIQYHTVTKEEVRTIIANNGEWRGEAYFNRPTDNKLITLLICFKLLKDKNEIPYGHLISATDITERKMSELKLKESENRFREMADSALVMIWISDTENKITYVNKTWVDFTGVDLNLIKNMGWIELVHPEDVINAKNKFDKHFEQRIPVTLTYRLKQQNGEYKWVQESGVPRKLSDGNFIGFIGTVVDIHDQKLKEEQLRNQAIILENVSDVIVTTDLEFNIESWNKIADKHFGMYEKNACGKKLKDLFRFEIIGSNLDELKKELFYSGSWKGECWFEDINGDKRYFLSSLNYIFNENGDKKGILLINKDISGRKLAEEKLMQSELFYRTLIADSSNVTLLSNTQGLITFSSNSIKYVLGYEEGEIIGRNLFEFVHPEDISWAMQSFERKIEDNPVVKSIVIRLLKKDGGWLWCMVRGHNLLNNPYIKSFVIYFHDDSLRKQANDALKLSEKKFSNVIHHIQLCILVQDPHGKILLCNNAFTKMFLANEENLIGKSIYDLLPKAIREDGNEFCLEQRPTYQTITTKKPCKDVVMGTYLNGSDKLTWILVNSDPILDENGEIIHIICSIKDITESKMLQEQLLLKQINHQKQLTQATIDGQENERTEIGKELHDNIGQRLTTIKLFLDLAKSTADDATNEMVSMAIKNVVEVIDEVRSISKSLIPSTLKDLGLTDSINELIESISRSQFLNIEFNCFAFDEQHIPENQKLTIFRIIQEQLNNIVKHSGAKQVWIQMRSDNQHFLLEIKDNGSGFDYKNVRKGLGLVNIKNRAELFRGSAEISTFPGEGCKLTVILPRATDYAIA